MYKASDFKIVRKEDNSWRPSRPWYICLKKHAEDFTGHYLWKDGSLRMNVGVVFESEDSIKPTSSDLSVFPGYYATKEEAKACLNKFLQSQPKENDNAS